MMTRVREATSRAGIARILGVAAQTVGSYTRSVGFPEASDEDTIEILAAIEWWLANKAPRPRQAELHRRLSMRLGVATDIDAAAPTIEDRGAELDLRLKEHRVAKAIGDCVSFSDIRGIVGELAANLRQACEAAQQASGRDVRGFFDSAFLRFEEQLTVSEGNAGEAAA